jgi:hypothetical protein
LPRKLSSGGCGLAPAPRKLSSSGCGLAPTPQKLLSSGCGAVTAPSKPLSGGRYVCSCCLKAFAKESTKLVMTYSLAYPASKAFEMGSHVLTIFRSLLINQIDSADWLQMQSLSCFSSIIS